MGKFEKAILKLWYVDKPVSGLDICTRKFSYMDRFGENFLVVLLVAML